MTIDKSDTDQRQFSVICRLWFDAIKLIFALERINTSLTLHVYVSQLSHGVEIV